MADIIAAIALYGTRDVGSSFLVQINTDIAKANGIETIHGVGGVELVPGRNFTEAVWTALDLIQDLIDERGLVRVFASGGYFYADINVQRRDWYGNYQWNRVATVNA